MARQDIEVEEPEKPKLTRESLKEAVQAFQYIRPYRWYFLGGLILLFLGSLIFMAFPYVFGIMVDVAQGESELDLSLEYIGLALIVMLIIQGTLSYLRVIFFANVSERGIADLRKSLYKKLVSLPITFFEDNKMGALISRLTADVEKLANAFSVQLAEFLRQLIILLVGVGFLFFSTPRLTLIMLLSFPVVIISAIFFGRYIRKYARKRQKKLAESNALLGESLQAIQIIKAFVNEWFEIRRYNDNIQQVVKYGLTYARSRALFAAFIIMVLFGSLFFVIWQGAMMVQDGSISVGSLIAFVSYTAIIGGSIGSLGNFYSELLGALGATERIREILQTDGEVTLLETSKGAIPSQKSELKPLHIDGHIQFQNVQFTYPSRPDTRVLNGIDIDIPAGQKVAIVGPSGAGKSTIIQLLLRFYQISGGDITVDGQSIYDHDLRSFRDHIGIVPQEVILFGGTVRENILYGKEDATEEEVIAAAQQSNSWDFIQELPEGLDTVIGERGTKLSGGQRQRIAIARALLKNPAILLLDEATSSLDAESEKVVQKALDKLMVGRTSIIIAHRLSTIRDVDCIYVLDHGQIVEQGTHEELILNREGLYTQQARLGGLA